MSKPSMKDVFPKVLERFENTHILYLSPWFAVTNNTPWGFKPIPANLFAVEMYINDYKVAFNRTLIGYHKYPNQMYMNIGVRGQRDGLYIEIPDSVWAEIIEDKKVEISVECTIFPELSDDEFYKQMRSFHFSYYFHDDGDIEYEPVRTMKWIGRATVTGEGRHLVLSDKSGMEKSILGFANKQAYEHFSKNYEDGVSQFSACQSIYCIDDDFFLWKTCHTTNFAIETRDAIVGDSETGGYVYYTNAIGLDLEERVERFIKDKKEKFFEIVGTVTLEKKILPADDGHITIELKCDWIEEDLERDGFNMEELSDSIWDDILADSDYQMGD